MREICKEIVQKNDTKIRELPYANSMCYKVL